MSYTTAQQLMYDEGRRQALELQSQAAGLTNTELCAESEHIPRFQKSREVANMLARPVGFVCKSTAGRVVRLIQPYDSDSYPQEPEELSAQWGFAWSTDPGKALPFIALSTSPYMKGDCCTEEDTVYRSTMDNNVWAPGDYPQGWEPVPMDTPQEE